MITLINEDQLLDIEFRKKAIERIQSDANRRFKRDKLKAYQIYKDLTKKWVIESISKEFSEKTVNQMVNRAANISVARKINDKKARCYAGGVVREIEGEEENTKKLGQLVEFLSFDSVMKKADRLSELLKNVEIQALYQNDPVETMEDGKARKRTVNRIMLPHQYDPIVHAHDKTHPVAFVLSDFYDTQSLITDHYLSDYTGTRDSTISQSVKKQAAMPQADEKPEVYIWWSGKYHFTTDDKGNILDALSPEGRQNPMRTLTFTSVHGDQDDSYWCEGGDDLVDGAILVNVLMTDLFAIMNVQGWGQLVITGKKIPDDIKGGPHRALTYEYDTGEPVPKVEYVSSNPPIDQWRECITMYVALLLSTNGLSTSNISTSLDGAQMAAGIAMMLDNAESMEPVEDKQKMFKGAEKKAWKNNFATHNYLVESGVAVEAESQIGLINTKKQVVTKFHQSKPIMTEAEKVDIMQKKKNTGLYTLVEMLMIKDPELKTEEAEKKAEELLADRMKNAAIYASAVTGLVDQKNKDLENAGEEGAEGVEDPQGGEAAAAATGDVQKTALNGAQLSSLVEVVEKVATGTIPRDSAVQIILQSFPFLDQAEAERLIGSAGRGFKAKEEKKQFEPAHASGASGGDAENT